MTESDFLVYYDKLVAECRDIVIKASKEYSSEGNKFENFLGLASKLNLSKEKILLVYMQKHIDGIYKYVNDPSMTQRDSLNGRIIDAINYLIILAAMNYENGFNNNQSLAGQITSPINPFPFATGMTQVKCEILTCKLLKGHAGHHEFPGPNL